MHTAAGQKRKAQASQSRFGLLLSLLATLAVPMLGAPLVPAHAELTVADPTQRVAELLTARAAAEFPSASISAATVPLDPRLNLAPCSDLDLQPRGTQLYGRIPVACPWTIVEIQEDTDC